MRQVVSIVIVAFALLAAPEAASAQWSRPPGAGGLVASLGQPPRWRWQAGLSSGVWFEGPGSALLVRAGLGTYHTLFNPVAGLADIGFETYAGFRDTELDGGVRALLRVPFIGLGIGTEYNFLDTQFNFLVTAQTPVIRGGLLRPGGMLRVSWYPTESHSFTIGFAIPLGDRLAGRGRPARDNVVVDSKFPHPRPYVLQHASIEASLDTLRESAEWVRRLTVPFLDQDGKSFAVGQQRTVQYLLELQQHLATRSADQETRFYHQQLQHLFALASGNDTAGSALAQQARSILLDEVIIPYNSLLGRKKRRDELLELGIAARGRFAGSVVAGGLVPPDHIETVLYVFQEVTELLESERDRAAKEWDDPRLVWLPLQYALLPEDHDTQAELDSLVERATGVQFTDGNRIWYLANLQFHWELLRTISEARDYHVLLIHDFPAVTKTGRLDWAAFVQVLGYLNTLTERVKAYDQVRTLPIYFIFVDQHYYELRHSRIWMNVLQDPLHASPHLQHATPAEIAILSQAQDRLRAAVAGSSVLQAEAHQYGDTWLRNRIKVQVNITNRADEAFWSGGIVSSLFAYPDNFMRDHRKVAFYDVTESDPYRGRAVYTGMGVGEHYLGPGWDDRSIMVQGPVLAELKSAVRELLVSQGLPARDVPLPLRAQPVAPADALLATRDALPGFDARALQLTNGTGFQPKPLDVGKALLYSLMPAGSVIKIPDSLWNSFLYAGLLTGACLRGANVLIVAPALSNAPSGGFPQMIRAWELMTRMLTVRDMLAVPIHAAGGMLQLGLYALTPDQRGFASRVETWNRQVAATPFLTELMPFLTASAPALTAAAEHDGPENTIRPLLHQKVQFLGTGDLWSAIASAPEWPEFLGSYLAYREATFTASSDSAAAAPLPAELDRMAHRIYSHAVGVPGAAGYAIMGSQNQDYRGMFMDGEVDLIFSGAESLVPLVDLIFLEGTATWLVDQQGLDSLLPPPTEYLRRWARVLKDGV